VTEAATVRYFAYGSNMSPDVIGKVAPRAEVLGVGRIDDRRLAFTRRSTVWQAGVADIPEYPGFSVYGILYAIHPDELIAVDRKEGAPHSYQHIDVTVTMDPGPVKAMTYTVVEREREEIPPHPDYLRQIIDGAGQNKLPQPYLDFLSHLKEQFAAGVREDGLLLAPTVDRRFSAGEPLIRLNHSDGGHLRHGRFGSLLRNERKALGRVELADSVPAGICQADQALRACIGVDGLYCFGHRVKVLPCVGALPQRSPIQPRALMLPAYFMSRNDAEKNYCVLHPDRIKVLGLQDGDFARLYAAAAPVDNAVLVAEVKAITIRVFSGSATEIARAGSQIPYPDRSDVYLDKDTRRQLGFPDRDWERTPVLIRPALWRALGARALFYGLTVLLGIGAVFQMLQAFAPHWGSVADALVALILSLIITMGLSVVDLRSRFRY
jgi:AIG2-like family